MSQFIQTHWEALSVVGGWAFLAFASTIPEQLPYKPQDLWAWFRSFVLEFMSQRANKLVSGPSPKAAVEIPQPIASKEQ